VNDVLNANLVNDVLNVVSYSNIVWDKLARFRDLVSHHYTHIDHEIVFDICKVHIPKLKNTLQKMRSDLPDAE
jgi:uncharacterized protein with HEPN domain